MSLLTAHRILIGAAIVFFLFYAAWEAAGGRSGVRPDGWELRAGAALFGAVGLALYFKTLFGRRDPGGNGDGDKGGGR